MDADATLDTPETSLSPARVRLRSFAEQLHALEGLVRSMEGRLGGMEAADRPDAARIKRVVASAAVLARGVGDAGTLTARELERESSGAKPVSDMSLVAFGHEKRLARPRRRVVAALRSLSVGGAGFAAYVLALGEKAPVPWWVGALAAAVSAIAGNAAPAWGTREEH